MMRHPQNISRFPEECGLSMIELLISMAIMLILSAALLTGLSEFFKNGQALDELGNRANNAAQLRMIAPQLLTQASYIGTPTTTAVSSPWLVPNPNAPGSYEGINIQWVPYNVSGGVALCTATLADHASTIQNGAPNQVELINGIQWNVVASAISRVTSAEADQACGVGRAYFPTNNQWDFYGPVSEPGCPGNQQAIIITNIYQYNLTASNYSAASQEEVMACLPNVQ